MNTFHRLTHKKGLDPGLWHVHVKAKNEAGWSRSSIVKEVNVPGRYLLFFDDFFFEYIKQRIINLLIVCLFSERKTNSATRVALPVSFGISIAALVSIYSINFSTRLFGWMNVCLKLELLCITNFYSKFIFSCLINCQVKEKQLQMREKLATHV